MIPKLAGKSPGRCTLTARSDSGASSSRTGSLTIKAPAAIVRSEILPELPLSVFSVFNNPRLNADSTLLMEAPILEITKNQDVVVVGGRRITIKVK